MSRRLILLTMMNNILQIQKPWYSAGKRFRWPYQSAGVGINVKLLENDEVKIRIGSDKELYIIPSKAIKEFGEIHSTYFQSRTSRLIIFPLELIIKKEDRVDSLTNLLLPL